GQVVELVDIMPTVLDLLGMEIPAGLSGRSLLPFIADPGLTDGGVAVTTMYGSAAIRTNDYRYIRYEDGSTELYDLGNDPNQWHNLAADPAWQAVRSQLDSQLRSELEPDGWVWVEAGQDATGTAGDELFVIAPGSSTVAGANGDDVYFITAGGADLVEAADGGTDIVYTSISYTLPDHVENLQLRNRSRNKTLIGNDGDNHIVGGNLIRGADGDDWLQTLGIGRADGGAGDDFLQGGVWAEDLRGGDGNDRVSAGAGADMVAGGAGNDRLDGGEGVDTLFYSSALAGVGVSLARGGAQFTGGAGTDTLSGFENVTGSGFADRLEGDHRANILSGDAGNDVLDGGRGNDVLDGGEGTDTASYALAASRVVVNLGRTTPGNTGGAGIDRLVDVENLIGSLGNDVLTGSAGNNRLEGRDGGDRLNGAAGSDVLIGGLGRDTMAGGLGNDIYFVQQDEDQAVEGSNGGRDQVRAYLDHELADHFEELRLYGAAQAGTGNGLANVITGTAGDNQLAGAGGDDTLRGGGGGDRMNGGAGNDRVDGGSGRDIMQGNDGADVFLFDDGDSAATRSEADVIVDRAAGDRIDLRAVDASSSAAGDDAFTFIGRRAFSGGGEGAELRYRQVGGNTFVEGDVDGDGLADLMIRLNGEHLLVAADFIL
ncbi:MAG TPA: sulfatase/phosphatase domain-containing protein, partial [Allosphingosinicella sp.]|nr:sulfatase/phosphatase domain-containing protein [Allosphingosinicella sp.]